MHSSADLKVMFEWFITSKSFLTNAQVAYQQKNQIKTINDVYIHWGELKYTIKSFFSVGNSFYRKWLLKFKNNLPLFEFLAYFWGNAGYLYKAMWRCFLFMMEIVVVDVIFIYFLIFIYWAQSPNQTEIGPLKDTSIIVVLDTAC